MLRTLAITLSILLLSACASAPSSLTDDSGSNLLSGGDVYTLTNLHADPKKKRLFAVNYQQPELIPLCTKVKLDALSGKKLIFTTLNDDQTYQYFYHKKAAAEPFDIHLKRYFGSKCNAGKVNSLSKIDQAGIKAGIIKKGMSKDGVILAAGYPPRHVTPSTDVNEWTYWKNRYNRVVIEFDAKGTVKKIID